DSFGLQTLAEVGDADIKLETEVNVLITDSLAWDVIKRLRLDQRPEMGRRLFAIGHTGCVSSPGQSADDLSPQCRRLLLNQFHGSLRVQAIPRTEILEIRYRSTSPEKAAEVVNTLAEMYIERNF